MSLTVLGPLGSDSPVPLPLFLSRVPAGFPSPADDYVEAVVDLNEVCGVGTECARDVRVSDFAELVNAGTRSADLECYVLAKPSSEPFVPSGRLEPGAVRGWGERDLGFRLAKSGDRILLLRMGLRDGVPALEAIDEVEVSPRHALSYRSPEELRTQ